MVNPLLPIVIALVTAYVFSEIMRLIKLPRVIGQLTAGFILGIPFLKEYLFTPEASSILSFFANIGIILLFAFIGLEINLKDFKTHAKESLFIALFNTSIPLILGFLTSFYFFNLPVLVSLIIGIALSVSAQAISLDILEEAKLVKTKLARLIITTGTVSDVFQFFLISILLFIFGVSFAEKNWISLLAGIIFFLLLMTALRYTLIPFALHMFEHDKSKPTLFMGALIIVLVIALLAESLQVSALLGALLAGMIVRRILLTGKNKKPWEEHEIANAIHLISFGMFVPLFFVWVGLQTSLFYVQEYALLILALVLISLIGTIGGSIVGVLAAGRKWKEGLLVGWGVVPKGDTELVIATLALTAGVISQGIFSAIVFSAFLVTIIGPIIFNLLIKKGYART